jgi:hypothetical protein
VEQLQLQVKHALVAGMKLGLQSQQPWVVQNATVIAWNTYLPSIQSGRCAFHLRFQFCASMRIGILLFVLTVAGSRLLHAFVVAE